MDSTNLEKRIIYLKGVQAGILQGTNPNVTKYKLQIDYEVASLEKEFQKLNHKENNIKQNHTLLQNKNNIKKNIKIEGKLEDEDKVEDKVEDIVENKVEDNVEEDLNISKMKFIEISKNINMLKDKIFQNNNLIKLLNRNKTYQNSLKIQNILKQNSQIQLQIQQKQQIYDLLNLKINNNSLYQKLYQPNHTTIIHENQNTFDKNKQPVKSILKSKKNNNLNSIFNSDIETKKHIQINIEKNEVKEIPVYENKKNIVLQKKVNIHKNNNNNLNNQNNSNTLAFQNKRPEIKIEESDEDLMKEFQNTIGSLQKLLI